MALALLADAWARNRGGSLLALIVDHGLRRESAAEAIVTTSRLAERGVAFRLLHVEGLAHGPALAERARDARMRVLVEACRAEGIVHLLLGHHANDQAETVLIRDLGGSGPAGLAGILPLVEMAGLRVLRPLLAVPPVRLRKLLASQEVEWVEDPSNADRAYLRPRLRLLRRDRDGTGPATSALVIAAAAMARQRAEQEWRVAVELSGSVSLRPEGFALLPETRPGVAALAALLQTIAGAPFPPPARSVEGLAARWRAATLAGVRVLPAGRLGSGWLMVREAGAMAGAVPAVPDAIWDGRFRLGPAARPPAGATFGAVGADAPAFRRISRLPSAVLRTLPAIRSAGTLLAVPHLHYPDPEICEGLGMLFSPARAAAAAPYRFGDA